MRQLKVTGTAKTATARAQVRRLQARPGGSATWQAERRVLSSCSVVTRGEVKGWGDWIDETFLGQVVEAGNAAVSGVKARFGHPTPGTSGIGRYVGAWHTWRVDKDRTRADLHFEPAAALSPVFTKDPAPYISALAENAPDKFGISIVYVPDYGAEARFLLEHGGADGAFKSPDPQNTRNLPHARLAALLAADVEDDVAANATGIYSARTSPDFIARAEALQAVTPGLSFTRAFRTCVDRDPSGYLAWRRRGAQKGRRRGTR